MSTNSRIAFGANAAQGLSMQVARTWSETLVREPRLLVPVHLDVLMVRSEGGTWARTGLFQNDAQKWQQPAPFEDLPQPRAKGAYLMWAPPDALARGRQAEGDTQGPLQFAGLPDRWLVLRVAPSARVAGRRTVRGWVLRADQPQLPPVPLDQYKEAELQADGQLSPPVTVMGPGQLNWVGYFDNAKGVMAFHDPLSDVKEGTVSYLVCGWYRDPDNDPLADPDAPLPHGHWLRPLWQFAQALSAVRDRTRGKPENNDRIEYGFEIDGPPDDPDSIVRLVPRQRNAPLDRLVAEFMILANTQWGALLARHGVPGIYRSQQTGRTRMSTQALPHESIAVPQYIWSTSPLRRYVDLINQGQILAAAEHGVSARLAAPFKPKDADLYALIGAFDSQYTAWSEFQSSMERYWCIRWMRQQGLKEVRAHVLRENLVRLACAPFVTRINGLPEFERGHEVRLDILGYDEIGLEVEFRPRETG